MRRLAHSRRPAVFRQPPFSLRAGFAAVVLALAAGPVAAQNVQLRLAASCRNPPCRKAPPPRRR